MDDCIPGANPLLLSSTPYRLVYWVHYAIADEPRFAAIIKYMAECAQLPSMMWCAVKYP